MAGYKVKKPTKVVIAAGNGTAGRFAPIVFRNLGCEVVELDCTPDWEFKRFNPNPEDIKFLHSISEETKKQKADIGIGIDGDGDRIGVVDDQGTEVFSDKLGLLLARWICKDHPGRAVVIVLKVPVSLMMTRFCGKQGPRSFYGKRAILILNPKWLKKRP